MLSRTFGPNALKADRMCAYSKACDKYDFHLIPYDVLDEIGFFTAPASSKYHGAYEGGLCEHSLDVYHMAKKAIAGYELELTEESVVVATLFHDLCKVNFYKKDVRNQKINGTWQEVPCYTIEEKYCFGGHGSKSVFLVQQFMKLMAR